MAAAWEGHGPELAGLQAGDRLRLERVPGLSGHPVIVPCPCRRLRPRHDAPLISMVAALQGEVGGLLVVQRLSKPAVLPGARGVIVARRRVLVMPWPG